MAQYAAARGERRHRRARGIAGQIAIHTHAGQWVIANGAVFFDKAIAFLLNNANDLRSLAGVAPEGFGFLTQVIDWLKMKLRI